MKVSDAVAEWLSKRTKHVFCISGGASLHLIHGIAKRKDISYVCPQHEQSAGFMADAMARLTGFGVALATSGPGATNLVTPIAAAYYDSLPILFLTGNQTLARMGHGLNVRQFGFQAMPIVEVVKPIVKWAKMVMSPSHAIANLDQAWTIMREGRPGPVLLDWPDDIQRAQW